MKFALARITYGSIQPQPSRHLHVAIMHAARNGVAWVGDISPDRMVHAAARNLVVETALRSDADAVAWVDDDIVMPAETFTRLHSYMAREENPLHFVSGTYFQRRPPYWPLFAHFDGEHFRWASQWIENAIAPVDGIGFGCCVTTTSLLRKVLELPEVRESRDKGAFEYAKYSEDLTFSLRAAKVGHKPHVDTGILLGHIGEPEVVTVETFKRWHSEHPVEVLQKVEVK